MLSTKARNASFSQNLLLFFGKLYLTKKKKGKKPISLPEKVKLYLYKKKKEKSLLREIYTDGSHKGKWGSWAFILVENGKITHEASGRERYTNSHSMEFRAAEEALKYKIENNLGAVTLFSDSREMIKSMHNEAAAQGVNLKWIKAHTGHIYNERCDQLCVLAREHVQKSFN